ncbi:MAG TPA: translation initiation factor IF-3 [Spirochaetota bacterium]|nr:translation initiation factor IF-3 [Spirochaetota bacterium]
MAKKNNKREKGPRLNEKITAPNVRCIIDNGNNLGVMPVKEALSRAKDEGLDLVEISPSANPPVCKIIDYGKYIYKQKKKKKEAKKNQKIVHLKEIKMRPKTDIHDYNFKVKHAKEFIAKGDRVKFTIRFRGREMNHTETGFTKLNKIMEDMNEVAIVDSKPKMEGRNIFMTIVPRKK